MAHWTQYEVECLTKFYPKGGAVEVARHINRTRRNIVLKAIREGVSCDRERQVVDTLPLTPAPTMTLTESLACIQFRKWGGPVNRDAPMRWAA